MSKDLIHLLKTIDNNAITHEVELLLYRMLQRDLILADDLLLNKGEICDRVWYIEKGVFRCFRKHKGQEENVWFMSEGDVMFVPQSFYGEYPSRHYIQARKESIVHSISKSQLNDIYINHPRFERIGRLLTEKYYLLSLDNWEELASGTVKDRYNHFLKVYPTLADRLQLRDIASFIKCSVRSVQRAREK
ncbi:cyclic nucleotide-binding domain-containing protein [Flavitalea sp. BT771]|uniref:Crp/Fnr family transcriptional regulator n=1 Tax=Flavitalea sp. BT771 TaxID=3063329 RepID=UPI0026E22155|nr:cyclic nucleotide-binding domain-containing protein [Flavitalea sp. BT771]MDO6434714.1 cyclic nucleotide-binding domain-containing protein [Flavitalea sp. BT771]MDV6223614.1 cyclic nucleotide-binding domain-containing protein [Flavitalea sp. BT771]